MQTAPMSRLFSTLYIAHWVHFSHWILVALLVIQLDDASFALAALLPTTCKTTGECVDISIDGQAAKPFLYLRSPAIWKGNFSTIGFRVSPAFWSRWLSLSIVHQWFLLTVHHRLLPFLTTWLAQFRFPCLPVWYLSFCRYVDLLLAKPPTQPMLFSSSWLRGRKSWLGQGHNLASQAVHPFGILL